MAEIEVTATSVVVSGHDLSSYCTGYRLDVEHGQMPRLSVDLHSRAVLFKGEASVHINDEVAAILKVIGWTPPRGQFS